MFSSAFRAAWLAGLLLLSACASAPTRPASPDPVLLISIDALRASYLGRGDTPHLDALARDGVRAQWMTPSYPTLTFPNHYTLVTGQRPDHHGVIHNSMREAGLGEFKVADTQATGDARWWSEATPIWVTAEQHGLKTAIWAWPGSSAPIGGVRPNEYRLFDTAIPAATRAADVAGWLTGPVQARPALAALYMEDVDEEGHNHGPDSPQVREALRRVDAAVGALLDTLRAHGQLERTNIVIVSDHGMATVAPEHVIAVEDMVSKQEAVVVSVGQVVGVQPNPGFEAAVEARLLGRHPPYTCWRKGELPSALALRQQRAHPADRVPDGRGLGRPAGRTGRAPPPARPRPRLARLRPGAGVDARHLHRPRPGVPARRGAAGVRQRRCLSAAGAPAAGAAPAQRRHAGAAAGRAAAARALMSENGQ